MKKILSFLILTLSVTWAFAASRDSEFTYADSLANVIMASPDYIYGEGYGAMVSEADKNALSNLMSKISVSVSSSFEMDESELNTNDDTDYNMAVRHLVKTYSQGTLTNTGSLMLSSPEGIRIMRYIPRAELEKVFQGRRDKVLDMVYSAGKSEKRLKIDDALRSYYWALCLLKSIPHPEEVSFTDEDGAERVLLTWIPEQINSILGDLSLGVASQEGSDVDVMVRYRGEPVSSVEYIYFDGRSWSARHAARDGMGTLELRPGADTDAVQVRFEYEYADQAGIDRELAQVMEVVRGVPFSKSQQPLASKKGMLATSKEDKKMFAKAVSEAGQTDAIAAAPKDRSKICASALDRVVAAIGTKNFGNLSEEFTPEGREMFDRLVNYGNARLLGKPEISYLPMGPRIVARSIPMSFTFPGNNRVFVEDVTFTFNEDNKIEAVALGLGKEADRMVFGNGGTAWSEYAKMILVNFIENYKTAFALKRFNYIESIFDDNATIIVGHVVKAAKQPQGDGMFNMPKELVKYTNYTKDQYLRQLAHVFETQPHINIRFTDSEVVKMGVGGESYGIQLKQDYYSTGYADTGYLFLLVDFNNPEEPSIKVRAWQPERNPDINSHLPRNHPDYGLILSN